MALACSSTSDSVLPRAAEPEQASRTCPVCGGPQLVVYRTRTLPGALEVEHLKITDANYGRTLRLLRCRGCGFVSAEGDELAELSALYARLDDPEYLAGDAARRRQMGWLLDKVLQRVEGCRTLLDVGCAAGMLLDEAGARGLECAGVEPSVSLSRACEARGHRVHQGVLPHPELEGRAFDLVTLVDVIEHVADPVQLLHDASQHLNPDGVMLVVTPNLDSLAARVLRRRWWHFRAAHVGYFAPHNLRRAAGRAGLELLFQFPAMWFFPVEYLLERLSHYVPMVAALPLGEGGVGTRLRRAVVPLALRDSVAFVLKRYPS